MRGVFGEKSKKETRSKFSTVNNKLWRVCSIEKCSENEIMQRVKLVPSNTVETRFISKYSVQISK